MAVRKISSADRSVWFVSYKDETYSIRHEVLNLESINISEERQRRLKRYRVDKLKRNFMPPAVTIRVARRPDGSHYLIGGQHCMTACKELGYKEWVCMVIDETSANREALLALAFNDVSRNSRADEINGLIHAEDQETLRHIRVLNHGGRVWKKDASMWNIITGFSATTTIEEEYGENELIRQLKFANDCWAGQKLETTGSRNPLGHDQMLLGICIFLVGYKTRDEEFPEAKVKRVLKSIPISSIVIRSDVKKVSTNSGHTIRSLPRGRAIAKAMADLYNENCGRGGKQLVFKPFSLRNHLVE